MNTKKAIIAAFAGTALLAAAGVQAQSRDGRWDHGGYRDHGYNHSHYRYGGGARVVVRPSYSYYYGPRYVAPYYAPAPVYYQPAPVYYSPAPAIYGRIPLGHHSSLGFSLPLY